MTKKIIFSLVSLIAVISFAEPVVLTDRLEPLDERITAIENSYITSNNLPIATSESLGGVKVGDNLNVEEDGTLSVPNADANAGTRGTTYLLTSNFGTTSEDGRIGYATTEYAVRQFIKGSLFPYPIFQTTNTYTNGSRVQYKSNIYECTEDNVSGAWSIVSNKFEKIEPVQKQIDDINNAGYITLSDLPVASTTDAGIVQLWNNGIASSSSTKAVVPDEMRRFAMNGIYHSGSNYDSSQTYNAGDRVLYGYTAYECLISNTKGKHPATNPDYWKNLCIQDQLDEHTSDITTIENELNNYNAEEWTFTMADGSTVSKNVGISSNSWPDTCVLWWTTNWIDGSIIQIPTNFPTRKLEVRAALTNGYSCKVNLDPTWDPGREVEIELFVQTQNAQTNASLQTLFGSNHMFAISKQNTTRIFRFNFDVVSRTWRGFYYNTTFNHGSYIRTLSNEQILYPSGPSTVEEWIELYRNNQQIQPNRLMLAPSPSPSVPTDDEVLDNHEDEEEEEVFDEPIDIPENEFPETPEDEDQR